MDPERRKRALEKAREEDREEIKLTGFIREQVFTLLINKGYKENEIEIDPSVRVSDGKREEACTADFILRPEGRDFAVVLCPAASLESTERHAVAFSRVAGRIPLAIVTNGLDARVLDSATGKLISEGLGAVPERESALKLLEEYTPQEFSRNKLEKEGRILLAFNLTRCSLPDTCPPESC